jgi:hypothetical protein
MSRSAWGSQGADATAARTEGSRRTQKSYCGSAPQDPVVRTPGDAAPNGILVQHTGAFSIEPQRMGGRSSWQREKPAK